MVRVRHGDRQKLLYRPGQPGNPGPDFCPFHTALATGQATSSTLRSGENHYYHVHAAPVHEVDSPPRHLIVNVRDVTNEVHQQQKMAAIHQAGMELADLAPAEITHMAVQDRIELLKSNILHFTRDLLHFDVVEVRLLDQKTGAWNRCWRWEWTRKPRPGSCSPSRRRTA